MVFWHNSLANSVSPKSRKSKSEKKKLARSAEIRSKKIGCLTTHKLKAKNSGSELSFEKITPDVADLDQF